MDWLIHQQTQRSKAQERRLHISRVCDILNLFVCMESYVKQHGIYMKMIPAKI